MPRAARQRAGPRRGARRPEWLARERVAEEGRAALLPHPRQRRFRRRRLPLVRQAAAAPRDYDAARFEADGARVVPGAIVRAGAHVGRDVVLMPSFVNVGAYVGEGTMVDTWATVGSCAQVGRNVHLSGGVGIGGVLEPLQARPTIIE